MREVLEGHRCRVERRGELHCVPERAAAHGERGGAATLEGTRGFFSDLPGSEQQHARGGEVAIDFLREVNRDVGNAHLPFGDRSGGADVLGGLKCFLEYTVSTGPVAPADWAVA